MRYGNFGRNICLPIMGPVEADQKTVAERKWQSGLKPVKAQLPADHGLFSDDHLQLDLVEMFQDPVNE